MSSANFSNELESGGDQDKIFYQKLLLLTWVNFNNNMDK